MIPFKFGADLCLQSIFEHEMDLLIKRLRFIGHRADVNTRAAECLIGMPRPGGVDTRSSRAFVSLNQVSADLPQTYAAPAVYRLPDFLHLPRDSIPAALR